MELQEAEEDQNGEEEESEANEDDYDTMLDRNLVSLKNQMS